MTPRFRLQLATKGRGIAALAVLVGVVLLLAGGYVYAAPPTEEPTEERVDTQRFTATVGDRVTVERETPLYQPGAVLENHPAYFTNTADNITLTGAVSVPANRSVSVTYRLTLRAFADRADETVWTNETLLVAGERTVTDGEIGFEETVDVVALSDYLFRVEEITQTVAGIRTQVVLEATYRTVSTTGEPYEGTLDVTRELRIVDNAYWVEGEASATNTESVTVQGDPVTGERDTESALFLFGGGVFLLLLARGVDSYRRTLPPTATLARAVERATYAEWISVGEHVFAPQATYVEMGSLGDLANLAIDANRRIIYDETDRVYVVTLEDQRYYWLEPEQGAMRGERRTTDQHSVTAGAQPVGSLSGGHIVPSAWRDEFDHLVARCRNAVENRGERVHDRVCGLRAAERAAVGRPGAARGTRVGRATTTLFVRLRTRLASYGDRVSSVSQGRYEHPTARVESIGQTARARLRAAIGEVRRLVSGSPGDDHSGEALTADARATADRSHDEPAREEKTTVGARDESAGRHREPAEKRAREPPRQREWTGDEETTPQTAVSPREQSTPTTPSPDTPETDFSPTGDAIADGRGEHRGVSRRAQPPTVIHGIGERYAGKLADAGVTTVGQLAVADPAVLCEQTGVSSSRITRWVGAAKTWCDGVARDDGSGRTAGEDARGSSTADDAAGSTS